MTGTDMSSADLSPRRRRMLFRAWHRGIREMDLLLGRFADHHIAGMDEAELDRFEALLAVQDLDLYGWIAGQTPIPPEHDSPVFQALLAFHAAHPTAGDAG